MSIREKLSEKMNHGKIITCNYEPTPEEQQWHLEQTLYRQWWDEMWTADMGWSIDAGGNIQDHP